MTLATHFCPLLHLHCASCARDIVARNCAIGRRRLVAAKVSRDKVNCDKANCALGALIDLRQVCANMRAKCRDCVCRSLVARGKRDQVETNSQVARLRLANAQTMSQFVCLHATVVLAHNSRNDNNNNSNNCSIAQLARRPTRQVERFAVMIARHFQATKLFRCAIASRDKFIIVKTSAACATTTTTTTTIDFWARRLWRARRNDFCSRSRKRKGKGRQAVV